MLVRYVKDKLELFHQSDMVAVHQLEPVLREFMKENNLPVATKEDHLEFSKKRWSKKLPTNSVVEEIILVYDNLIKQQTDGKIKKFKIIPQYNKQGTIVGLNINIYPIRAIEHIKMNIVITKDGCEFDEDNNKSNCPKCGGNVVVNNMGYYCENSCGYEMII